MYFIIWNDNLKIAFVLSIDPMLDSVGMPNNSIYTDRFYIILCTFL